MGIPFTVAFLNRPVTPQGLPEPPITIDGLKEAA